MFSFNFGVDNNTTIPDQPSSFFEEGERGSSQEGVLCEEIECPMRWHNCDIPQVVALVLPDDVRSPLSGRHSSLELKRLAPQSDVFQPESLSFRGIPPESDLVPGSYGGGYKVWECSLDLCRFVLDSGKMQRYKSIRGGRVLELGCGHGLPGLAAYIGLGAANLILTDLNREVIEDVTWPNVLLNCRSAEESNAVRCISGDWADLKRALDNANEDRFDLILTAETLYTEENGKKLLEFFRHYLSPAGVALMANKRYYFGVGGGTSEFQRAANTHFDGEFCITVAQSYDDGCNNIRDLMAVTLRGDTMEV